MRAFFASPYGNAADSHPTPAQLSATKTSERISQCPSRFTHCAEYRPPITVGPETLPRCPSHLPVSNASGHWGLTSNAVALR